VLCDKGQYGYAHRCTQIDPKDVMQVLTVSKYDTHSAIIKQELSEHCPDRHHFSTAYAHEIRDALGARTQGCISC